MFDNRKQRVPELFISKIEIDKHVDESKKYKVVELFSTAAMFKKQAEIRKNCHIFCVSKKEDKDGGGTPAGGTVGRYADTYAVAA